MKAEKVDMVAGRRQNQASRRRMIKLLKEDESSMFELGELSRIQDCGSSLSAIGAKRPVRCLQPDATGSSHAPESDETHTKIHLEYFQSSSLSSSSCRYFPLVSLFSLRHAQNSHVNFLLLYTFFLDHTR